MPKCIIASSLLVLCALLPTCDHRAMAVTDQHPVMPMEAMTPDDLTRAGIRGTGCAWRTGGTRSIRFAASGDRAVVKVRGAFHELRRSPGAADMFPFTYDGWVGVEMSVRIVAGGTPERKGGEASGATLEIVIGGRPSKHRGFLDCGT